MSDGPKKSSSKKATTNKGTSTMTASVRDVVAHANHLREVVAIVRAASVEFVGRFGGVGQQLPELLLQREGAGARAATVEAIMAAEAALEDVARELEARALALLSTPVESDRFIEHVHAVAGIGADHVVYRDHLDSALRPSLQKSSGGNG